MVGFVQIRYPEHQSPVNVYAQLARTKTTRNKAEEKRSHQRCFEILFERIYDTSPIKDRRFMKEFYEWKYKRSGIKPDGPIDLEWSTYQCRLWVYLTSYKKYGRSVEEAMAIATKWVGNGEYLNEIRTNAELWSDFTTETMDTVLGSFS